MSISHQEDKNPKINCKEMIYLIVCPIFVFKTMGMKMIVIKLATFEMNKPQMAAIRPFLLNEESLELPKQI